MLDYYGISLYDSSYFPPLLKAERNDPIQQAGRLTITKVSKPYYTQEAYNMAHNSKRQSLFRSIGRIIVTVDILIFLFSCTIIFIMTWMNHFDFFRAPIWVPNSIFMVVLTGLIILEVYLLDKDFDVRVSAPKVGPVERFVRAVLITIIPCVAAFTSWYLLEYKVGTPLFVEKILPYVYWGAAYWIITISVLLGLHRLKATK